MSEEARMEVEKQAGTDTPADGESTHSSDHAVSRMPFPRELVFVTVLCTTQLMTQACLGQSIAPLLIVGDSFGITDPALRSWQPAAYSLTVGTFILPAGRLGDVFGHRRIIVVGYAWLALWSVVAGLSVYSGQVLFDVCRAMQGIGPALLLPNAIAILGRSYPPGRRKDTVFSLLGATAPNGFIVGALFSSLFAQLAWWPWAYYATAIASVLLAGACRLAVPHLPVLDDDDDDDEDASAPPTPRRRLPLWQRLDVPGTLVGVAGLVLFNFAWNQGPIVGWPTTYVYVILILGAALIALFFLVESRAPRPLLPVAMLSRESGLVIGCVAAGWSAFGIWIYYLWQFMEVLQGATPLLATAHLLPVGASGLCAALTTSYLLGRVSPGWVMLISMTSFTAGTAVLATLPVGRSYWAGIFVSLVIMPWGMDMSFPSACIIMSNNMPPRHQGIAASIVNTAINYSISIGLGMAGTVESHVDRGGQDVLGGYRGAWYLGIGLAAVGMAVSVCFVILGSSPPKAKSEAATSGPEKGG